MIYPHRIKFLDRGMCDVCGETAKKVINTNNNHFFGWESCNKDICNDTIKEWYNSSTILKNEIIHQLGEKIKIYRSNGILEHDWIISSDAHQEEENGPHWVYIKYPRKHLTKEIQLSDLYKWNKKHI